MSGRTTDPINALNLREAIQEYLSFVDNHSSLACYRSVRKLVLDPNELEEYAKARPTEQIGILLRNRFITVLNDVVESIDPNGSRCRHGYLRIFSNSTLAGACGTVVLAKVCDPALNGFGQYVLVQQERHATGKVHLEFPRGFGTKGLTAEENALDELKQETGLIGHQAILLGTTFPDSGLLGDSSAFFYVPVVGASAATPEQSEAIVSWISVSLDELQEYVADGKINDGFTVQGIGLLLTQYERLKKSLPMGLEP